MQVAAQFQLKKLTCNDREVHTKIWLADWPPSPKKDHFEFKRIHDMMIFVCIWKTLLQLETECFQQSTLSTDPLGFEAPFILSGRKVI